MLETRVFAAADGDGSALLVQGDAGIGKSSLLAAACELADTVGVAVLRAGALLPEADRPFGLVRSLLRALERPFPVSFDDGDAPGFVLEETVSEELDTRLSEAPHLLVIDDLQWADEASRSVIRALVRRVATRPVFLLLAGRHPEPGSAYDKLVGAVIHDGVRNHRLGPLSDDDVAALAERRFGVPPASSLRTALARATGNPFYVRTVLEHLAANGQVEVTGGVAETIDPAMSSSLREAVLGSVTAVAGDREILQFAAVIGSEFALGDLAAMARSEPLATWARVGSAVRAGLVEDRDAHLAFRHDLVREAVYAEIPPSLRAELHRRAAEALAETGHVATVVAGHLLSSPRRPDPWAVEWLGNAGREASPSAPATAARFLRSAIELCVPGSEATVSLTGDLVMNMVWSADLTEAERLAGRLTSVAEPTTRGALQLAMGWAMWLRGRTPDAARLFRDGAADASLPDDHRARLAALAAWVTGFQLGQGAQARALAADAASRGAAANDEFATILAGATELAVIYLDGRPEDAAVGYGPLVAAAQDSADPGIRNIGPHLLLSITLLEADRVDEADASIAEGTALSRQAGPASMAAMWHRTRALRDFATGQWDDAVAELAALNLLSTDTGLQLGSTAGDAIGAMIAVHRGDLASAADIEARAVGSATGPEYRGHWIEWARALRLEAEGRGEGAFEALASLWSRCATEGPAVDLPWIGPDLVRLAVLAEHDEAASLVVTILDAMASSGPPTFKAAALHARGIASHDADLLLAAAASYRPGRRRFREAIARIEAAEVLVEAGRRPEAREAVAAAVPLLHELQASPAVDRAVDLQRRAGGRMKTASRRPRPTEGWESLTPSEARVALLVADGLSNPEIATRLYVSRRTVESHMAQVLRKLGLRSRVQVVRVVLEASAGTDAVIGSRMS